MYPSWSMPSAGRAPRTLLLMVALSMASWCLPGRAHSEAHLTGTATYRERVALAADAVFEVSLLDVSRPGADTEAVATQRKKNPGQVPIAFDIAYDPGRIRDDGAYVLRAVIYEHGRPRFNSDRSYPVLTGGHGATVTIEMRPTSGSSVEREPGADRRERAAGLGGLPASFAGLLPCADCAGIRYLINFLQGGVYMQRLTHLRDGHDDSTYELGVWSVSSDGRTVILSGGREGSVYWAVRDRRTLRKLDAVGNPIDSKLRYELSRASSPEAMQPRLRLVGHFLFTAEAARFRDCATDLRWPVAMGDDYRSLEAAYAKQRPAPGEELLVSVEGRIEPRPRMEGGGGEATLVVEKFLKAMPGRNCEDRNARAELVNTRWRPVRIADRAVTVPAKEREPWIQLDPVSKRVVGSGGCNRVGGSYEAGTGTLQFGPLISTKMLCPSMNTEVGFFRALEATRRYRLLGRMLELLDEQGNLLARLEERNLR